MPIAPQVRGQQDVAAPWATPHYRWGPRGWEQLGAAA